MPSLFRRHLARAYSLFLPDLSHQHRHTHTRTNAQRAALLHFSSFSIFWFVVPSSSMPFVSSLHSVCVCVRICSYVRVCASTSCCALPLFQLPSPAGRGARERVQRHPCLLRRSPPVLYVSLPWRRCLRKPSAICVVAARASLCACVSVCACVYVFSRVCVCVSFVVGCVMYPLQTFFSASAQVSAGVCVCLRVFRCVYVSLQGRC